MDGRNILDKLAEQAPVPRPQHSQQVLQAARHTRLRRRAIGLAVACAVAIGVAVGYGNFLPRPSYQRAASQSGAGAADPAAGAYAASIAALAVPVHSPLPRPQILYVLDNTCASVAKRPPTPATCSPRPISATLRRDLAAALRPYAPVKFINNPAAVTGAEPGLTVQNGGVLVTLGPIQLSGMRARVPIAVRRAALDGQGLTYLLTELDGNWKVTGTAGGSWTS